MDGFDFSSLFGDGSDSGLFNGDQSWLPADISGFSADPSLGMVTPPDSTGLGNLDGSGSLDNSFNIGNGGIANMSPAQLSQLASQMGLSPSQLSSALGLTSNGMSGTSQGGGLTSGGSGGAGSLLGSLGGLGGILPLLLAAGSGLMGRQATQQATQQTVQGINNASTQAQGLIGGAQANYQPYMQAGGTALSKLANAAPSNIAGQFKPLGTGRYVK